MFENFLQLPTISDLIALTTAGVACYGWWRERRTPKTVIEIEYHRAFYCDPKRNMAFFTFKVLPGFKGIDISSISFSSCGVKEVQTISLSSIPWTELGTLVELSDDPVKVNWEIPPASECAGPWFATFLVDLSNLPAASRIALTIRQVWSLPLSMTKTINHHAAIRLRTPNNETIAIPTIRIEL